MNDALRQIRDAFLSLKVTVALLVLAMILVFAATLDQVNLGVWAIQEKWFRSLFVLWNIPGTSIPVPVFPGGYLLGGLLFVNLVMSHLYRFKLTWRKSGIFLTHLGLILLLVGELLTGLWQEEFKLQLREGESRNYAESYRRNELAIVEDTDPKTDAVTVVPEERLRSGEAIQHPELPFRIVPKVYFPNAALGLRPAERSGTAALALAMASRIALIATIPVLAAAARGNNPPAGVRAPATRRGRCRPVYCGSATQPGPASISPWASAAIVGCFAAARSDS